jgi:hypothetical protein
MNKSDEQCEKAEIPTSERLEFDSNVTVARALQEKKQESPISLTEEGIQIDESDEQSENKDS